MSGSNVFVIPSIATVLYIIIRCIESYYLTRMGTEQDDEDKVALKLILRDAFLVFICTMMANAGVMIFTGHFHQLMNVVTETKSVLPETHPAVFTDIPEF